MSSERTEQIDVRYVAKLARIDLNEAECATFQEQLSAILGYIDALKDLDLDATDTEDQPAVDDNYLREDLTRPSLSQEDLLSNAPESAKGQVRVPKSSTPNLTYPYGTLQPKYHITPQATQQRRHLQCRYCQLYS